MRGQQPDGVAGERSDHDFLCQSQPARGGRRRRPRRGGAEARAGRQGSRQEASKGLAVARGSTISGFKGKKEHDRRSSRARGTEIRAARAGGDRTRPRTTAPRIGSISAAPCAGCSSGKEGPTAHIVLDGGRRRASRPRTSPTSRSARCSAATSSKSTRAKTREEERRRRRERQDAEEDRHPLRRSASGDASSCAARAPSPMA